MRQIITSRTFLGDVVTLIIVTIAGFASHGTLGSAGLRMLTTFFPLLIAWLLIAPYLGVYDPAKTGAWKHLWRPFWAMVLAAPFAAWLRAVLLGTAISTIFVVVLGGISALALFAWRGLDTWLILRKQ